VSTSEAADSQGIADSSALAEAERSGRPFLVFRDGQDRQRLFLFAPDSDSATVGRLPSSDLVIDWDAQVSREHARFERLEDAWVVVDDGLSSNGTFVNGARIRGTHLLSDGDVVRFGTTTVIFHLPAPDQPQASDAAGTPTGVELSSTQRRVLEAVCRPCQAGPHSASPATDEQIADELVLSVAEVRGHLNVLYAKLDVDAARPDEARARLVERAFAAGLISAREL